jgi:hypothetical protein
MKRMLQCYNIRQVVRFYCSLNGVGVIIKLEVTRMGNNHQRAHSHRRVRKTVFH